MSPQPQPPQPTYPSLPDLPWPPKPLIILLVLLGALLASAALIVYLMHVPPPPFSHTIAGRAWKGFVRCYYRYYHNNNYYYYHDINYYGNGDADESADADTVELARLRPGVEGGRTTALSSPFLDSAVASPVLRGRGGGVSTPATACEAGIAAWDTGIDTRTGSDFDTNSDAGARFNFSFRRGPRDAGAYTAVHATGEDDDSTSDHDREQHQELPPWLARIARAMDRAAEELARLTQGDGGEGELVMRVTAEERGGGVE
ncbi:uncharacterized protein K452DRAFT_299529 [Aplosporella prunicola CBS 121167]|uniref:Uncharacterized protein n=1 Tax=Aplosporella prunicola CBS 121167 TaxID=1176127 RepID=A0A6A6BA68_9PEZI|nr:uncharacterized protein K452DRAFT_299529 [Aplosporella prunicola CBS 121167]KAF2140134.1 hypothetical protein K452DRAFT_299529 [Aplosporella prunicola CBS 121167]